MPRPQTKTRYYALEGGLDTVTPALSVRPGRALAMVNFEPWYQGGYRRVAGYERFDGRPKPSDATFTGFEVDTVAGLTLRDVITGDTSGATGVLIGIWDDDGTYGVDSIGVTKVTGTFQNGETCNSGAFTIGSVPAVRDAPSEALIATWLLEAEADYRDDIAVVPGLSSTPVRGAWRRGANTFAVRDNAGATAGILHVASASGWTTSGITMASYVRFDAGLAAGADVVEGDTLTGGTSGATATIHRIVLHGGSNAWDGSGEGYLVITGITGTFQDNESLESPGATAIATADGTVTQFAFPTGGVYRFLNHNFFAGADTYRTYGVNGVGPAFEIDEDLIVSPILHPVNPTTGEAPNNNKPFLIEEFQNHLFFAFEGGSLQHAVPGRPLVISGFLGAAEFGLGDDITSLNSVVGNVLIVTTRRQTRGLFGSSVADWSLKLVAEQTGGLLNGAKKIDTVYSLDDLGISSVARSDQFGDFISATVSKAIQPLVITQRPIFTDSTIVRESNQVRLYFSDKSCIVMYVAVGTQTRRGVSDEAQFGFLSYDISVAQIYNTEDETGKEHTYFVTDDDTYKGYVFEDRIGKNFDGEPIASYVRLAFNHVGSPSYRKRFRRADLELSTESEIDIQFSSDLSYGAPEVSSGVTSITSVDIPEVDVFGAGGFWGADNWDEFVWDGQSVSSARAQLSGSGENIGFLIFNETAKAKPWVMQGLTLHYDLRRLQR